MASAGERTVGTPATLSARTATDDATVKARRVTGGPSSSSSSSSGSSSSATPGTNLALGGDGAFGLARPRRASNVPRVLVAAALGAVVVVAAVAVVRAVKPLSREERIDASLDKALVMNPTLHREVFLAMIDIARHDPEDAHAKDIVDDAHIEAIADQTMALCAQRLTTLRAHKNDDGYVDKARAILKGLGDDDVRSEE